MRVYCLVTVYPFPVETGHESLDRIQSADVTVTEHPDIDLAVIATPVPLCRLARMSAASQDRVLTRTARVWYQLEYSDVGGADRYSRSREGVAPVSRGLTTGKTWVSASSSL